MMENMEGKKVIIKDQDGIERTWVVENDHDTYLEIFCAFATTNILKKNIIEKNDKLYATVSINLPEDYEKPVDEFSLFGTIKIKNKEEQIASTTPPYRG
jgi:hypothetical protein